MATAVAPQPTTAAQRPWHIAPSANEVYWSLYSGTVEPTDKTTQRAERIAVAIQSLGSRLPIELQEEAYRDALRALRGEGSRIRDQRI